MPSVTAYENADLKRESHVRSTKKRLPTCSTVGLTRLLSEENWVCYIMLCNVHKILLFFLIIWQRSTFCLTLSSRIQCQVCIATHTDINIIFNTFYGTILVEYLSHSDRYASELRKACLLIGKLNDSPAGQVQTLRYYYSSYLYQLTGMRFIYVFLVIIPVLWWVLALVLPS